MAIKSNICANTCILNSSFSIRYGILWEVIYSRHPNNMPTKEDMKFFDSYMKIRGGKAGNAGKRRNSKNTQQIHK